MCRLLVVLILLSGSAPVLAQSDDPRPINRTAHLVTQRLEARDFAYLENLSAELLRAPRLLADGQPELAGFYAGVSLCVHMRCGDQHLPAETWVSHGALLDEWIAAYPQSVTAKLAKAAYLREYAWFARGVGFANTVSEAQWRVFAERINQALTIYMNLRMQARGDPAWHEGMLSIGLVQRWPEEMFDAIYQEGTGRFPYYLPLYFLKAAYISPRWEGSDAAFRKYVEDVVQATSKDMGETMYARLHWSSSSFSMFDTGQTEWSRMREGFVRMTADFPDQWNINNFASYACRAGDVQTLRQQLARITVVAPTAWGRKYSYEKCTALAE